MGRSGRDPGPGPLDLAQQRHGDTGDDDRADRGAEPAGRGEVDRLRQGLPERGPAGHVPGVDQLVGEEPAQPGGDRRPAEGGPVRDVPVAAPDQREVDHGDGEERHEDRADQVQEALVPGEVHQAGQQRADDADPDRQPPAVDVRGEVVHRHRRRIDVRERLVHLVDHQDEQRDTTGRQPDERTDQLRVGQVTGEVGDGEHAEGVVRDRGQSVARGRAGERRAGGPRVPRVVGGQRGERHHTRDGEVDGRPEADHAGPVDRAHRLAQHHHEQVHRAGDHQPHHDRPQQLHRAEGTYGHRRGDGPGQQHERPAPLCTEDGRRGGGDDDQLHRAPADVLQDVQDGRHGRAAAAEQAAQGDHRRRTGDRAEGGRPAQDDRADRAAHDGGEQTQADRADRQADQGAGERAEERDPEVGPQGGLGPGPERTGWLGAQGERCLDGPGIGPGGRQLRCFDRHVCQLPTPA
ncbi:hypothetical protein SDC9_84676 [bioreactor metagenome]|uniref:Uncharacterized protein n=1 Tax=bioreactor metagenome TaxID=1076179 RepID=A0A644ZH95_9ZZZZ